MFNFLKSKTVWTAIITAAVGLGCFLTSRADLVDLVQIESIAALAVCLRHGVAKAEL